MSQSGTVLREDAQWNHIDVQLRETIVRCMACDPEPRH